MLNICWRDKVTFQLWGDSQVQSSEEGEPLHLACWELEGASIWLTYPGKRTLDHCPQEAPHSYLGGEALPRTGRLSGQASDRRCSMFCWSVDDWRQKAGVKHHAQMCDHNVFAPWIISAKRGDITENNCWVVIFTRIVSRAVHIEVLESQPSSSFVNALGRLTAVHCPVCLFHSDQEQTSLRHSRSLK